MYGSYNTWLHRQAERTTYQSKKRDIETLADLLDAALKSGATITLGIVQVTSIQQVGDVLDIHSGKARIATVGAWTMPYYELLKQVIER